MSSRKHSAQPIPIAETIPMVCNLNEEVLDGNIPGFHIAPQIFDRVSVLSVLVEQTRSIVPNFGFNSLTDSRELLFGKNWRYQPKAVIDTASLETGLHFDTGFQGIAVHINRGLGSVALQATTSEQYVGSLLQLARNQNVDFSSLGVGPRYQGELSPDVTITVFAEDMLLHKGRSAALHHFKKAPNNRRHWQRFGYLPPEVTANHKDR